MGAALSSDISGDTCLLLAVILDLSNLSQLQCLVEVELITYLPFSTTNDQRSTIHSYPTWNGTYSALISPDDPNAQSLDTHAVPNTRPHAVNTLSSISTSVHKHPQPSLLYLPTLPDLPRLISNLSSTLAIFVHAS